MSAGATAVATGPIDFGTYDFGVPDSMFSGETPSGDRVFNVLDFGAIADASVDNRPMIQAAINAAHDAGGGTVYVPPGVYGVAGSPNADGTPNAAGAIQVLSNVFLQGAGAGETTLRLVDGSSVEVTGIVRSPWGEGTTNWGVADLTIDGNKANTTGQVDGFFSGGVPGLDVHDADVIVARVEVKDVSRYGVDPHEQTDRLVVIDTVSHDNGKDGFTIDFNNDSVFLSNEAYGNGRHGFNIVTESSNLTLYDNISHDNGGAGFVVQRGASDIPSPDTILLQGGTSYGNGREGVLVQMSDNVVIDSMEIHDNGMSGVRLLGASHATVTNNIISNNSQIGDGAYSEVQVEAYADTRHGTTYSADANLIEQNQISSTGDTQARYLVEIKPGDASGNEVGANALEGGLHGNTSTAAEGGTSFVVGTDFADTLVGSSHADAIIGNGGSDTIVGQGGNDLLRGGDGDDVISGGKGDDNIDGGAGNDRIDAGSGNDIVFGREGDDHLDGNSGNDTLIGQDGNDILNGGSGDDRLEGGAGDDIVNGGSGDDTLVAGTGHDTYIGGSGFDTLDFSDIGAGITVDLSAKTYDVSSSRSGTVDGIESVIGARFDDNFRGNDDANVFDGGGGNDVIRGAGGNDILTGGEGFDRFVWETRDVISTKDGQHSVDRITDFSTDDVLDLTGMTAKALPGQASDVVKFTADGDSTMVSVKIGSSFVDVVHLDHVQLTDVNAAASHGLILV